MEKAGVRFGDYNNFWAPLSDLYWSKSSHICVSKHPLSSTEEIVSFYCPQCLTRYTERDAKLYRGRCPSCFQCPRCTSILSTIADSNELCILSCGMCAWKSDICEVTGADRSDIEVSLKEKELKNHSFENFSNIENCLAFFEQARVDKSRSSTLASNAQQSKRDTTELKYNRYFLTSLSRSEKLQVDTSATIISQRIYLEDLQPESMNLAIPSRIHMLCKKKIRCRQDIESGKPSILIQPKFRPLEGDSSSNEQRGKWWDKDASAIHELPSIMFEKVSHSIEDSNKLFLSFSVSNPRDVEVSVNLILDPVQSRAGRLWLSDCTMDDYNYYQYQQCQVVDTSEKVISFVLGAFEDELLRDGDNTQTEASATSSESPKVLSVNESYVHLVQISHNIAKITLAVELLEQEEPQNSVINGCIRCLEMDMSLSWPDSQDSSTSIPVVSCVIVIPQ